MASSADALSSASTDLLDWSQEYGSLIEMLGDTSLQLADTIPRLKAFLDNAHDAFVAQLVPKVAVAFPLALPLPLPPSLSPLLAVLSHGILWRNQC